LYLIFGDFNFCFDEDPEFLQEGWKFYPKRSTRTTARLLSRPNPIDYILLKTPFDIEGDNSLHVKEFSPLPLQIKTIKDDMYYWFSNESKFINETPFKRNDDLRTVKIANRTLDCNTFLNKLIYVDEFEKKESVFTKLTTLCFDHNFLFFSAHIPHTVLPCASWLKFRIMQFFRHPSHRLYRESPYLLQEIPERQEKRRKSQM
jgi:hypothetical protein